MSSREWLAKRCLALIAHFLPFNITDSSNNLFVCAIKVYCSRKRLSDNAQDAEIFPSWFVVLIMLGMPVYSWLVGVAHFTEMITHMCERTSHFGAALEDEVRSGSTQQHVYIGAGLDTKLMRLARMAARPCTCFEMDLEHVIRSKRQMFQTWSAQRPQGTLPPYAFIGGDLNHKSVFQALQCSPTFASELPTTFLEEATFVYLEPARRTQLVLGLLRDAPRGSAFALTLYINPLTGEAAAPFAHAAGSEHAQKFLDATFGTARFSVRAYTEFAPGSYRSKPPGLASDLDSWIVTSGVAKGRWTRRMGVIVVRKN